ncbi:hypothetical protein LJB94_01185 [Odoribacter sp. OttesenSCG-928-G04]|nr:hypothetical protein [Odoribacter sp. OttesenSCG-928-G04]MDL2330470.1 hypothetical protein [Odoribacter sp. OttesenSCG-928-A06]
MKTPLFKIVFLLSLLAVGFFSCTDDDRESDVVAGNNKLTLQIPVTKASYIDPSTRVVGTGNMLSWEEGDSIYIRITYAEASFVVITTDILTVVRRGGKWYFSKEPECPLGTEEILIQATYIGENIPDKELYDADILYSQILIDDNSDLNNPIVLPDFDHYCSRIYFTNLKPNSRVWMRGKRWSSVLFSTEFHRLELYSFGDTDYITADENGVATLYTFIKFIEEALFSITEESVTTRPADVEAWHTFNPGRTNPDSPYYYNRSYTLDCSALVNQGPGIE